MDSLSRIKCKSELVKKHDGRYGYRESQVWDYGLGNETNRKERNGHLH